VEEQLRQEGAARQQAETRLQQEQAALTEARAALERERLAWEEVLGQLQQERTALEGAQVTLKQREDEVSRLNGELVQTSILHEDLCQSLEEQEAMVLDLQRQAEEACKSLEGEKTQVECESLFVSRFADLPFGDPLPTLFFLSMAIRAADCLGTRDHSGQGCAGGLQLLSTRVGRAAGLSYGPPWAHYLGGYQDRLLDGPLGLPDLRCTAPAGVKHKDYGGEVLR
jgi:hypothetical protein